MYRQEYAYTNHTHIATVMSKHDHNITVEDADRNSGTVTTDRWHAHDQLVAAHAQFNPRAPNWTRWQW